MVLVQKWPLFQLFVLYDISQEKFFYAILERKDAFLGYENKKFKGLTYGFGAKMTICTTFFFLGNIGQENDLYNILGRNNDFQSYNNKNFKKSKN